MEGFALLLLMSFHIIYSINVCLAEQGLLPLYTKMKSAKMTQNDRQIILLKLSLCLTDRLNVVFIHCAPFAKLKGTIYFIWQELLKYQNKQWK